MKKMLGGLTLLVFLAACGRDPMIEARAKLKARDYAAARQILESAAQKDAEKSEPHYALFVLYQYQMVNSDPTAIKGAIREYEWIAKKESLNLDYANMESSVRQGSQSRLFYKQAREDMYGQE